MKNEHVVAQSVLAVNSGESFSKTSIGKKLQRAREALHLSQVMIAAQLRLKPEIIAAIENDDYANLPRPTYIRGYIRLYAKIVKLVPDELVNEFNALGLEESVQVNYSNVKIYPQQVSSRDKPVRWVTFAVVSTLLVLVGIWWYIQTTPSALNNKTELSSTEKTIAVPVTPQVAMVDNTTQQQEASATAAVNTEASAVLPKPGPEAKEVTAKVTPSVVDSAKQKVVAKSTKKEENVDLSEVEEDHAAVNRLSMDMGE